MLKDFIKTLTVSRSALDQSLAAVDEIRSQIADQKALITRIEDAPLPVGEALAAFDVWAARQAKEAMERLGAGKLLDPMAASGGLPLPVILTRFEAHAVPDYGPGIDAIWGLMLATIGPAIRALIEADLVARTDGVETMSVPTKAKKIAVAKVALLDLELAEESAIRALEQAGLPVLRRADADPMAALASSAALPG